jgi:hypothetical protein
VGRRTTRPAEQSEQIRPRRRVSRYRSAADDAQTDAIADSINATLRKEWIMHDWTVVMVGHLDSNNRVVVDLVRVWRGSHNAPSVSRRCRRRLSICIGASASSGV